jgi:hypothetical protein
MPQLPQKILPLVLSALFLAGACWFFLQPGNEVQAPPENPPAAAKIAQKSGEHESSINKDSLAKDSQKKELELQILACTSELAFSTGRLSPEDARRALDRLNKQFEAAPIQVAVEAMVDFLRSRRDATTGLGFLVGDGGMLETAPTLRMVLLDSLGRIDPIAAAEFSREMLGSLDFPAGEIALALRNLDWGGGKDDQVLFREQTLRYLSNHTWAKAADAAYLEGYDAAARLNDPLAVGILAKRASEDAEGPVAGAATLALERLASQGHAGVLGAIAKDSRIPADQKGELLARADVRDPDQREILEGFLQAPENMGMVETFLMAFPLASHTVGPRLMTDEKFPNADERREADEAALEAVRAWLEDKRFARHKESLEQVATRLEEMIR